MKIIKLLLALSTSTLIFSCDDNNENLPKDEVQIRSTIAGQVSRAEGDLWSPNDAIGIFMYKQDESVVEVLSENNHYVTAAGNGSFTPINQNNVIYYPATEGLSVNFTAYYPHKSPINNLIYNIDVSNQAIQSEIDLLISNNAKNKTKADKIIELNFFHKLSKIIFKIIPGEGLTQTDLDNLEVSINGFNTKSTYKINEDDGLGELQAQAVIKTRTMTAGKAYEAIVLPTTVTTTQIKFDLKNSGGDVFTWSVPNNTKFESGKKHTYNVTIKRTDIIVTGTIEDWIDGTGGNVIAE